MTQSGRLEPMATAATANEYSRPIEVCRERLLRGDKIGTRANDAGRQVPNDIRQGEPHEGTAGSAVSGILCLVLRDSAGFARH